MTASKILIVEDETPIREMVAFHLDRAGFDTIETADGKQARQLLVDERPDLALIGAGAARMVGSALVLRLSSMC